MALLRNLKFTPSVIIWNVFSRCLSTDFLDPSFLKDEPSSIIPHQVPVPSRSRSDAKTRVHARGLTKRIKEHVSGPVEALQMIRDHERLLNPIHFSAILTRMASMSSPRHQTSKGQQPQKSSDIEEQSARDATIKLLERNFQRQLLSVQARQLANCCWGIAKLISHGKISMETAYPLAAQLFQHAARSGSLAGADATDLSLIAWSAYSIQHYDGQLLDALADSAHQIDLDKFKDHEVMNLLKPFAASKLPRPQMLIRICNGLLQNPLRFNSMEARHLKQLAFYCSAMQLRDLDFITALVMRSKQLLDKFDSVELCELVTSLLSMQFVDVDLIHHVMGRIREAAVLQQQMILIHPVNVLVLALLNMPPLSDNSAAACAHDLVMATFPIFSLVSGTNNYAKVVLVICASLRSGLFVQGEADLIKGLLFSILQKLTMGLQDDNRLSSDTISSLALDLPHLISQIMAPDFKALDQEVPFKGFSLLDSYCTVLRSATLLRLTELQADNRPNVLSSLMQAADQLAGLSKSFATRKIEGIV